MPGRRRSPENDASVIIEVLPGRQGARIVGLCHGAALELVIVATVFEFLPNPPADHNSSLARIHRDITKIEEPVQIAAKEEPIRELMGAFGMVR